MTKKLCKSLKDKKLFGVCGGIAEYFNIDSTIVRIIAILLCLFSIGTCIIVYLVVALIMPNAESYSKDFNNDDINNMKRANVDDEGKSSDNSGKTRSDEEFDKHF